MFWPYLARKLFFFTLKKTFNILKKIFVYLITKKLNRQSKNKYQGRYYRVGKWAYS